MAVAICSQAQVKWTVKATKLDATHYKIDIYGKIDAGYYIVSKACPWDEYRANIKATDVGGVEPYERINENFEEKAVTEMLGKYEAYRETVHYTNGINIRSVAPGGRLTYQISYSIGRGPNSLIRKTQDLVITNF